MSDEKPSPGPWQWKPPSESRFVDPAGLKDARGADILGCSNDAEYIYAHSNADAALIADAPAMLDMLRRADVAVSGALKATDFYDEWSALLDKHGRMP